MKMSPTASLHYLLPFLAVFLSNLIQVTHTEAWDASCPKQCKCFLQASQYAKGKLRTIDCANKKLDAIPRDIPLSTQVLLLKGNVISSIHEDLPRFSDLEVIDLSHNQVSSFGPYPMFGNLTSLAYLNLENNELEILHHGSFSGLLRLEDLLLGSNNIHTVEDFAFGGLNHLRELSLSGNKLKSISTSWFEAMSSLDTLLLADNLIKDVSEGSFANLKSLARLYLAGNNINELPKNVFKGLEKLQNLNLDRNELTEVPTRSFGIFKGLKTLSLNGNPIKKIGRQDFHDFAVSEISLSNMGEMYLVDREAFYSLSQLTLLQMHDNPKFTYIDPRAFVNTPNLQQLFLHNNNLMALPYELIQKLPYLKKISFYHNPIHCDCNAYWIRRLLNSTNVTLPSSSLTFIDADKLVCDSPLEMNAHLLAKIPLDRIPRTCPPTAIAFFNDTYQMELGQSVTFECRAIGITAPHIHWILSNGRMVNNTSNYSQIKLLNMGTLEVNHLKAKNAGTYTCVATNERGYDTSTAILRIHSKNIHILNRGTATNFITITWNGTDSTVMASNYLILYRKRNANDKYGQISLRPYMRTYTITNLEPRTWYEFCIAYNHNNEIVKINCMNIRTKPEMSVVKGIRTLGNITIVISFTTTITTITLMCVGAMLFKRYKRRKAYQEPEGVNYKVDTMSNIPLDNLYNPPSTPLCTSTTNLIAATAGSSRA